MSTLTNADIFQQMTEVYAALEATHARMDRVLQSGERLVAVKAVRRIADPALLNRYCQEAMDELGVAAALVTLLDANSQEILGAAGRLVNPESIAESSDVAQSMCQYVVASGASLQVDNTSTFCPTTPGMDGMEAFGAHSYYGEPLIVLGHTVGSFCILDDVREWTDRDRLVAHRVARGIEKDLESRIHLGEIDG